MPWVSRYWRPRALSALASPWTSVVGSCSSNHAALVPMKIVVWKTWGQLNQTPLYIISYFTISCLVWICLLNSNFNGLASRYTYKVYLFPNTPIFTSKTSTQGIYPHSWTIPKRTPFRSWSEPEASEPHAAIVGWNMKTNWIQVLGNRNQNNKEKKADSRMAIMTVKTEWLKTDHNSTKRFRGWFKTTWFCQ